MAAESVTDSDAELEHPQGLVEALWGRIPMLSSPAARLTLFSGVSDAAAFPKSGIWCLAEPWAVF